MKSGIQECFEQAERCVAELRGISDTVHLCDLLVSGDRRATQEKLIARYRGRLSKDEQLGGNVALLVFERYLCDWQAVFQELDPHRQLYASAGQFPEDWQRAAGRFGLGG